MILLTMTEEHAHNSQLWELVGPNRAYLKVFVTTQVCYGLVRGEEISTKLIYLESSLHPFITSL